MSLRNQPTQEEIDEAKKQCPSPLSALVEMARTVQAVRREIDELLEEVARLNELCHREMERDNRGS